MYASYFGLKENPFNLTPDPRFLYHSPFHREAFDHLLYGINERKGFILITGGVGMGKTTLCRALLAQMDDSTKSALIFNSFISDLELLQTINHEFGIQMDGALATKKDYIDALNDFLVKTFQEGGNACLLIDEAQNLSISTLEQIRMLSNLETEKEKLIQIVLVGQPELNDILSNSNLKQLNERITVRYDLKGLWLKDIKDYMEHRLIVAGSQGKNPFHKGVYKRIYSYSMGNPRRINAVCDRALLIAYYKEKEKISKKIMSQAIKDVKKETSIQITRETGWMENRAQTVILLLILGVSVYFVVKVQNYMPQNIMSDILAIQQKLQAEPEIPKAESKSEITQKEQTKPSKKTASLFLDNRNSLAALFSLYKNDDKYVSGMKKPTSLSLVSLNLEARHLKRLKKPFRIHLPNLPDKDSSLRYLLIFQKTGSGPIVLNSDNKEIAVSKDFILGYWGGMISWVYPFKNKSILLMQGMKAPDVLQLQKILNSCGYPISTTGYFGHQTFNQVLKFQQDFDLIPDGIAGSQTRSLIYQMWDGNELHS